MKFQVTLRKTVSLYTTLIIDADSEFEAIRKAQQIKGPGWELERIVKIG